MPTLLHIDVSPRGNQSISRRLSDVAVQVWKESNPGGRVFERDLAKTPLTFVDLDWIAGAFSPPERRTESHKKALALSDELVAEVLEADEIILGTPMYNFSIPAALKAWIDQVGRAGKTFRYSADGTPEGLLVGKRALVIVTSGGNHDERSGTSALDHEIPYLRFIFGFMGITDLHFMHAGGTNAVMKGRISADDFLAPYIDQIAVAV